MELHGNWRGPGDRGGYGDNVVWRWRRVTGVMAIRSWADMAIMVGLAVIADNL